MARYDVEALFHGVRGGKIGSIGQAITLVESQSEKHQALSHALVERLMPFAGQSRRVGISGVPGVGKSTFLEGFGTYLAQKGRKLAVLAVDPSSERTGGSILGDKTRMVELSRHPNAFIRPSPSGGALGGVTRKTRETIIICEAAGFSDIFVETVGVGQSEVQVAKMVDCFLVLMLPTAGDELQGIKRGILELAHGILINKCDISETQTRAAEREYRNALRYFREGEAADWEPRVLSCSGQTGLGFERIESLIAQFFQEERKHLIEKSRVEQRLDWFMQTLNTEVLSFFHGKDSVKKALAEVKEKLQHHTAPPAKLLKEVLDLIFYGKP